MLLDSLSKSIFFYNKSVVSNWGKLAIYLSMIFFSMSAFVACNKLVAGYCL